MDINEIKGKTTFIPEGQVGGVLENNRNLILAAIESIYRSEYGKQLLRSAATRGYLSFQTNPAVRTEQDQPININFDQIANTAWFNRNGILEVAQLDLVIAHELRHAISSDLDPGMASAVDEKVPNEVVNAADWRTRTSPTDAQNRVAVDTDRGNLFRVSYWGSINLQQPGQELQLGYSYSEGAPVQTVRIASRELASSAGSNIDERAHAPQANLVFGLGIYDYINTSAGNDFVYAKGGNDVIFLGAGNDKAYDELDGGSDFYHGGADEQDPYYVPPAEDGLDKVSYSSDSGKAATIQVGGPPPTSIYNGLTDISRATFVTGDDGGIDALVSIEQVDGSGNDDTLQLNSFAVDVLANAGTGRGGLARTDLKGQNYQTILVVAGASAPSPLLGDVLDLQKLNEAAIVRLDIATPRAWASADSSRKLTVLGIDDVLGSEFVDNIYGNAGANFITSGTGAGGNRLYGMDGPDRIQSNGLGDFVDGGKGNDLIQLDSAKVTVTFKKGDGADTIEYLSDGDYTLRLQDITSDDVDVIAGGRDIYYDYDRDESLNPSQYWYQFLTIQVKSTGDQITLLENGRNFGIGDDGSVIAINKGFYPGQGGALEGYIDRIVFSGGESWNRSKLWNEIDGFDMWSRPAPEGYGGGYWTPENFKSHVEAVYLKAESDFASARGGFMGALRLTSQHAFGLQLSEDLSEAARGVPFLSTEVASAHSILGESYALADAIARLPASGTSDRFQRHEHHDGRSWILAASYAIA